MTVRNLNNVWAYMVQLIGQGIIPLLDSGAPSSTTGAGFAAPGSTYVDTATGNVYVNLGTKAAPVWAGYTLPSAPRITSRNYYAWRADSIPAGSGGTPGALIGINLSNPSVNGSLAESDQVDNTYLQFTTISTNSGAVSARSGPQLRHNPTWIFKMRSGTDVSGIRFWCGLSTTDFANVDDQGGTTEYLAFRFSTAASDPGLMVVTRDGATQSVHGQITTFTIDTAYALSIEVNGSQFKFTVNNGTPMVLSDNLSPISKFLSSTRLYDLGVARNWKISTLFCEYGI